jgi:hypothetical protein
MALPLLPLGLAAQQAKQERTVLAPGVAASDALEMTPESVAAVELGLDFRLVRDRPFRAELVIDIQRKLADGNTVQRTLSSTFYRDRRGRVRQDGALELLTPEEEKAPENLSISISDPAAGDHYVLFPAAKTGFRMTFPAELLKEAASHRTTPWSPQAGQDATILALGYQTIDGVQCQGRLETVTIPAGTVGNAFPIEIRTERWYAEELQMNLIVKRIDPRSGETTIRLVNIRLEDPPEALFQIPAGYQIQEQRTEAIPMLNQGEPTRRPLPPHF